MVRRWAVLRPLFYSVGTDADPNYRVVWRIEDVLRAASAEEALAFAVAMGYAAPVVTPSYGDEACGDFLARYSGPSGTRTH